MFFFRLSFILYVLQMPGRNAVSSANVLLIISILNMLYFCYPLQATPCSASFLFASRSANKINFLVNGTFSTPSIQLVWSFTIRGAVIQFLQIKLPCIEMMLSLMENPLSWELFPWLSDSKDFIKKNSCWHLNLQFAYLIFPFFSQ